MRDAKQRIAVWLLLLSFKSLQFCKEKQNIAKTDSLTLGAEGDGSATEYALVTEYLVHECL